MPLEQFQEESGIKLNLGEIYVGDDTRVIYAKDGVAFYPLAIVSYINLVLCPVGWDVTMLSNHEESPTTYENVGDAVEFVITKLQERAIKAGDLLSNRYLFEDRVYFK
jgi:hypothetical protein